MKLKSFKNLFSSKGFTLIELLIVIAVLGVLAAGVLVAIDPGEQLARGRDASRKSSISQLGRAIQAYYTANGAYLDASVGVPTGWRAILLAAGDIKVFPSVVPNTPVFTCTGGPENGFCYRGSPTTTDMVVSTRMESKSERNKCAGGVATWYVYSTAEGKAGLYCNATDPPVGVTGLL